MNRVSKTDYYLDIARSVTTRSTCLRRRFGAIIVKDDVIISTGYNGAPRGRKNCSDLHFCLREKLEIPRGERYELCRSVHAEANAIISAGRERMLGSDLYLSCTDPKTGEEQFGVCCCSMCKRLVLNAGIARVIVRSGSGETIIYDTQDWIENDDSLTGDSRY
ncbi:MAG TPA: cytidine deaminase [Bacillota bacterium]|nr:cytidine deaminase [Bacillota bacterium]